MFDNVGGKLKGLAIAVFVIGIIAAVIDFLVMIRFSFIGGLLTGGLMFLASWLGVLGIYALGEAAERSASCDDKMDALSRQIEDLKKGIQLAGAAAPVHVIPESVPAQSETRPAAPAKVSILTEAAPASVDDAFLDRVENISTVAEIVTAFAEYSDPDNAHARELRRQLEELRHLEIGGRDVRASAISKIRSFYKYGGRVFPVDRSGYMLVCPNCGKEQNTNRQTCYQCGALFGE